MTITVKEAALLRAAETGALKRFYYTGASFDVILRAGRTRRADAALLKAMADNGLLTPPPTKCSYPMARWLLTADGAAAYQEFKETRRWR